MSATESRVVREQTVTVFTDPQCDRCGLPLAWVWGEDEVERTGRICKDASIVSLTGGYGGFVDDEALRLDLCKVCTEALLAFLRISMDDERWLGVDLRPSR